ncbi:AGC protein kinase [Thecamonas trahens ATCC 50062]|uniref:non-specific serine/threonine protein kinase n=1 Tax=Thecamonas trahens ATCC 50062 TaxID=461836 RepID=A0A0L0DD67_THETB|nr:AGC protein kinase [Thecamonas trahens ATCC 50062]KNC50274.1 AGC protein kinase [Thecamonas trahens ATCC 50062]|eukprot:XP_013757101.1 AGC protein kinase [Thecamonas trahens ATCC 50062]
MDINLVTRSRVEVPDVGSDTDSSSGESASSPISPNFTPAGSPRRPPQPPDTATLASAMSETAVAAHSPRGYGEELVRAKRRNAMAAAGAKERGGVVRARLGSLHGVDRGDGGGGTLSALTKQRVRESLGAFDAYLGSASRPDVPALSQAPLDSMLAMEKSRMNAQLDTFVRLMHMGSPGKGKQHDSVVTRPRALAVSDASRGNSQPVESSLITALRASASSRAASPATDAEACATSSAPVEPGIEAWIAQLTSLAIELRDLSASQLSLAECQGVVSRAQDLRLEIPAPATARQVTQLSAFVTKFLLILAPVSRLLAAQDADASSARGRAQTSAGPPHAIELSSSSSSLGGFDDSCSSASDSGSELSATWHMHPQLQISNLSECVASIGGESEVSRRIASARALRSSGSGATIHGGVSSLTSTDGLGESEDLYSYTPRKLRAMTTASSTELAASLPSRFLDTLPGSMGSAPLVRASDGTPGSSAASDLHFVPIVSIDADSGMDELVPADLNYELLVHKLANPLIGVEIKDRRYHLRKYPNCFVGSDLVSWLGIELGLKRAEATRVGEELLRRGLVEHVVNEQPFIDGFFFYHFTQAAHPLATDGSSVSESGPTEEPSESVLSSLTGMDSDPEDDMSRAIASLGTDDLDTMLAESRTPSPGTIGETRPASGEPCSESPEPEAPGGSGSGSGTRGKSFFSRVSSAGSGDETQVGIEVERESFLLCRICEELVSSSELEVHSRVCVVASKADLKRASCDMRLQRLAQTLQRGSAHPTSTVSEVELISDVEMLQVIAREGAALKVDDDDVVGALEGLLEQLARLQERISGEGCPLAQDVRTFAARVAKLLEEKLGACRERQMISSQLSALTPTKRVAGVAKTRPSQREALVPSIKDFSIIKQISKGGFGRVFLSRKKRTGDLYAIKVLKKDDVVKKNLVDSVYAERNIMAVTHNPFVVRLYYSFQTKSYLYLVMEYLIGGDMGTLLESLGYFSEDLARLYIAQVVLALEHLHSRGIIHRDLKPDNILIDAQGHIKLTDFGLSQLGVIDTLNAESSAGGAPKRSAYRLQGEFSTNPLAETEVQLRSSGVVGTPDYLAPEILLGTGHGAAADWWAIGVLLYEFLFGVPPFNDNSLDLIFDNILNVRIEWFDNEISADARALIEALLRVDPSERLGSAGGADVRAAPFFASIEFESLMDQPMPFRPKPASALDTSYFESEARGINSAR